MKMIKILILALIFPIISLAQEGMIQFNPEVVEISEGETFEVEVVFNTADVSISVFDLHMVFDPQHLQIVSIENLQSDLFNYIHQPEFNNELGKIDMAAYQIGKEIPSSNFSVIQLTILALEPVELTEIIHPTGVFPETLLAYAGANVLDEASPLKVTITGEALSDGLSPKEGDFDLKIWPNPSSDIATIGYMLESSEQVNLSIYDLYGKLIREIYEGSTPARQEVQIEVDLKNLADGNYACRLSTGQEQQTKMLIVAK